MRLTALFFTTALAGAACDRSPTSAPAVSHLSIVAAEDSLQLGESLLLHAELHDSQGVPITDRVDWSSTDETVITVQAGVVDGIGPGFAYVRAHAGKGADSIGVTVVTSGCPIAETIRDTASSFEWSSVVSGATLHAHSPLNATDFNGVPTFYGSGILYGYHPDSTYIGYDYSNSRSDFRGGVCLIEGSGMHTASLLRPWRSGSSPGPDHPPGLLVAQDQWAFGDVDQNDFVIHRYRFTNVGSVPIATLRAGFVADFDVYRPNTNIGRFDPVTGVASVVSTDTAAEPVVGGFIALEAEIIGYRVVMLGQPRVDRAGHFALLAPGELQASQTGVGDVRQFLAVAPMTLRPGETRSIGYALVVGESFAEFMRNVSLARQKAASLW